MLSLTSLPLGFASTPATECASDRAAQPPVPAVMPGFGTKAHILLGAAPDYPPYTGWSDTVPTDPTTTGFNVEVGLLAEPICGIKIDFIFAPWSECWTAKPESMYFAEATEYVGESLYKGYVHGCTAYTHAKGERNWSLEFTHSILAGLKTAGILTRLDGNGDPIIPTSTVDSSSYNVGDVSGWAPTPDTFVFNKNYCVEGHPQFTMGDMVPLAGDGNEIGINSLLDGTIDALYIYADQMKNFIAAGDPLAAQFGQPGGFAYIHTGLDQWSVNGTTLAISKKGSGLAGVLNPCIEKIVASPEYMTVCEKYWGAESSKVCIGGADTETMQFVDEPMHMKSTAKTCADGYCPCNSRYVHSARRPRRCDGCLACCRSGEGAARGDRASGPAGAARADTGGWSRPTQLLPPPARRRRCGVGAGRGHPLSGEEWRLALSHEHDAYYFEPHLDEAANAVALHSGGKNSLAVQVLRQSRGRPGGAVKSPPFPDLIKKFCCIPE